MSAQEAYYLIVRSLPHRLRVMRMYRYGLRELMSWSSGRQEWYPRARALRMEFENNKDMSDREQIRRQVELGEDLISRFRHWEPLLRPEVPGGTAYGVNPEQCRHTKTLVNYDYLDSVKRGDWM